jgi:phosphoribosylanthranilate isomerase
VATFLLTSRTSVSEITGHHRRTLTSTIQIVDALTAGTYAELKEALPGIKIVQVIHVIDEKSVEEAAKISLSVDAILLDSGNPNLKVKELGGTGRVHNWLLSRKIKEQVSCPVFLAGGLKPENVREAIETVEPFAVDVCSGVRTNGILDPWKLERFFKSVLL